MEKSNYAGIHSFIEELSPNVFMGVDVEADSEPPVFPETVKVRNRILSLRPDGITFGNSSIFSIVGLATANLFKHFETYYNTSTPVVKSWPMDAMFVLVGPEKTTHWLGTNPLDVKYLQTAVGWELEPGHRDFVDLADFRDKYLQQPRRTGMVHGVFSNPGINVHVLDFAPIELLQEVSPPDEDVWMVDEPPARHHGLVTRVYMVENRGPATITDVSIFVKFVNEGSGAWHVYPDDGTGPETLHGAGRGAWLVGDKDHSLMKKEPGIVAAWEWHEKTTGSEIGGLGLFSHELHAIGTWDDDLDEEYVEEGKEILENDDTHPGTRIKAGYVCLKPVPATIPPGGHAIAVLHVVPARNHGDIDRLREVFGKDVSSLLRSTAGWWSLYLDMRATHIDSPALQDFIDAATIMVRNHYGPGDLGAMLGIPPGSAPRLGMLAGDARIGSRTAPRAMYVGSHYYDHRDAFVRDDYWISRAFLASGRLEEYLNNSFFFAEAFRTSGTRNAYSINSFYKNFMKTRPKQGSGLHGHENIPGVGDNKDVGTNDNEVAGDGTDAGGEEDGRQLERKYEGVTTGGPARPQGEAPVDLASMTTRFGEIDVMFHPEDVHGSPARSTIPPKDLVPGDLYLVGGGSSREYRMEIPAYRIMMLRDVDYHVGDDAAFMQWLPLIGQMVKSAGICRNGLHVILSDETWIWPCRIRDTDYHLDNTTLLLAAFQYLHERLSTLTGLIGDVPGSNPTGNGGGVAAREKTGPRVTGMARDILEEVNRKIALMRDAVLRHYGADNVLALEMDGLENPGFASVANEITRPFAITPGSEPMDICRQHPSWMRLLLDALERLAATNQYRGVVRSDSRTNAFTGNVPGYYLYALGETDDMRGDVAIDGLLGLLDATAAVYECHDAYDEFWGTEKRRSWDTATCLMGILSYLHGFQATPDHLEVAPHLPAKAGRISFRGYPYRGALYSIETWRDGARCKEILGCLGPEGIQAVFKKWREQECCGNPWRMLVDALVAGTSRLVTITAGKPWRVRICPGTRTIQARPPIPAVLTGGNLSWLEISRVDGGVRLSCDDWGMLDDASIEIGNVTVSLAYSFGALEISATRRGNNPTPIKMIIVKGERELVLEGAGTITHSIQFQVNRATAEEILESLRFHAPDLTPWHSGWAATVLLPGHVLARVPPFVAGAARFVLELENDVSSSVPAQERETLGVFALQHAWSPCKINQDRVQGSFPVYPGRSMLEKDAANLSTRKSWWLAEPWMPTVVSRENNENGSLGSSRDQGPAGWRAMARIEITRPGGGGTLVASREFQVQYPFWDAWGSIIENGNGALDITIHYGKGFENHAQIVAQELLLLTHKFPACQPLGDPLSGSFTRDDGGPNHGTVADSGGMAGKTSNLARVNILLCQENVFKNDGYQEIFVDDVLQHAAPVHVFRSGAGLTSRFFLWVESTSNVNHDLKILLWRLGTCTPPKRKHAINSYPYGLYLMAAMFCTRVEGKVQCRVKVSKKDGPFPEEKIAFTGDGRKSAVDQDDNVVKDDVCPLKVVLIDKVVEDWAWRDGVYHASTMITLGAPVKNIKKEGNWLQLSFSSDHVPMEMLAFKGPRARPMGMLQVSCDSNMPLEVTVELDLPPSIWLVKTDPGDRGQWPRIDDPVSFGRKPNGMGLLSFELHCGTPVYPLNRVGKRPETMREITLLLAKFPEFCKN